MGGYPTVMAALGFPCHALWFFGRFNTEPPCLRTGIFATKPVSVSICLPVYQYPTHIGVISFWQQPHPRVLVIYIANIAITQSSHLAQQLAARLKQAYHLELPRPQFQPKKLTLLINSSLQAVKVMRPSKNQGHSGTQHGNWYPLVI